jgi:hypothetical protein
MSAHIEKIVYRSSWRNFILANFRKKSFSTATPDFNIYANGLLA